MISDIKERQRKIQMERTEYIEYFEEDVKMETDDKTRPPLMTHLCDICRKHFKFQAAHKEIKYACKQCEYQATTKCSLKRHIKSVHQKVRYPCNQCQYEATEKGSLNKHIESVHEKVKYPCDQCEYKATTKSRGCF